MELVKKMLKLLHVMLLLKKIQQQMKQLRKVRVKVKVKLKAKQQNFLPEETMELKNAQITQNF